jgi:type I restriction enzyme S subunit
MFPLFLSLAVTGILLLSKKFAILFNLRCSQGYPQELAQINEQSHHYVWEQRKLSDISSKIGSGKTPSGGSAVYKNEGIPFLRSQNIVNNTVLLQDVAFIDIKTNNEMLSSEVQHNDILLNITGASIGRSAVYTDFAKANVNQHVCIIRLRNENASDFIQLQLSSNIGQRQIMMNQAGGGREGLNFQQIGKMVFSFTSENEKQQISNLLTMSEQLIASNQRNQKAVKIYNSS